MQAYCLCTCQLIRQGFDSGAEAVVCGAAHLKRGQGIPPVSVVASAHLQATHGQELQKLWEAALICSLSAIQLRCSRSC